MSRLREQQTKKTFSMHRHAESIPAQQKRPVPPGCSLQVLGFNSEGTPVRAGVLAEGPQAPIYVRGDKVRVVPLRKDFIRVDHAADSKEVFDPKVENGVAYETKNAAIAAQDELDTPAPESSELVDLGALPDADAKLERLPSNTPVLRAWGEATGVERRWRSASEADDINGMTFPGASYVSNAATVEVGDSDADSKDGSSNNSPSSSLRARGTWSRYPTLDDVIATALPMLTAVSSDMSDLARLASENIAVAIESDMALGASHPDGSVHGAVGQGEGGGHGAGTEEGQDESKGDDIRSERESTASRPRACAGAQDVPEEGLGNRAVECSSTQTRNWAVRVKAAAMPRKARLRLYLQQRLSQPHRGPTLEEAQDWMKAWTPEMDKSLLELLGAAGTKAVSTRRVRAYRVPGMCHHDSALGVCVQWQMRYSNMSSAFYLHRSLPHLSRTCACRMKVVGTTLETPLIRVFPPPPPPARFHSNRNKKQRQCDSPTR